MFLHGGWLHVLLNMWFLWIFGDNIEDLLGHAKYLVFYLLCGAVAGLGQVIANPYSTVPMVGASGAIAGVMGAYLIKFPRARILTLVFVVFFITTIEIPAPIMLVYWFVTQLFSGFGSIAQTHISQGGTAFFAHIGGFVAGIVLVKLMGATGQYNRRRDRYWE
jgi:membrane associated rhomboid family serine protease